MTHFEFEMDGRIDLVDLRRPLAEAAPPVGARQSSAANACTTTNETKRNRLNDVMIVLEGERSAIEDAIRGRLATETGAAESQSSETLTADQVELVLDERAPRFRIKIMLNHTPAGLSGTAHAAIERHVEAEVLETIVAAVERHTAHNPAPQWKVVASADQSEPAITVDEIEAQTAGQVRDPDAANLQATKRRSGSIWFRLLLLLLALMVLIVGYLGITANRQ